MYRITSRRNTRRRSRFWLLFSLFFLIVAIAAGIYFILSLHQKPVIKQAKAVITKVSYQGKLRHYNEGDFTIDIPVEWEKLPRPPYTYQSFSWHNIDKANGQEIEIYEDTIPANFAVNKALIVSGSTDHIELVGAASENCQKYTKNLTTGQDELGVPAKWQNVDFNCNRNTSSRDTIGTSSTDGINTVNLTSHNGTQHKFFFTYTDNQIAPDYAVFYNALSSFGMN
jgi:hypothetical protein